MDQLSGISTHQEILIPITQYYILYFWDLLFVKFLQSRISILELQSFRLFKHLFFAFAFAKAANTISQMTSNRIIFIFSLIELTVLGFLICSLRSNGFYAFALFVPVAIICIARYRKQIACCPIISFAASVIWLYPAAEYLNVESSKIHSLDALAITVQQMAYAYSSNALSAEEKEFLSKSNYQLPTGYNETLSDPSRNTIENMSTQQLIKSYLTIEIHHPGCYTEAFIQHT